jgi:thymidine phosphorylase
MKDDGPRAVEREDSSAARENSLRVRRMGVDTHHETVVFMHEDCHVCRSEGFSAHSRVRLRHGAKSIIATLYQVTGDLLAQGEAGLSEAAWRLLGVREGSQIDVSHPAPLRSLSQVRSKVYGERLSDDALNEIISDVVAGRYADIHLSALITACSSQPLDRAEMVALTRAMIAAGDQLDWGVQPVVDKHCVGGLPGNRTTPILVAIVTACGLTMPKTSSRAITSPAGTADTMETLAPVDLSVLQMRRVVEREGGCVVWGGTVRLSPADDILIRVERALDLDSEGQMVASILSKKIAAGSTHVVLDLPVGPTAKVRSAAAAKTLSTHLQGVAEMFGVATEVVVSDGSQPVGRGIGPALEARDVLAVLQGTSEAPVELRERALTLAAALLDLGGATRERSGRQLATAVLDNGQAWQKFQAICEAQGGMREPPVSVHRHPIVAAHDVRVSAIDNRNIARVAKLAGAPEAKAAGVDLHAQVGDGVARGDPLFTIHAESPGELSYALDYARSGVAIFDFEEA